ncbi:MAG TPA: hypothetical protein VLE21_03100 [Candidatus Nitrosocosmicus sp.]|nr:hypothetical protein [Candidatus Nitrosocosmicus sp.]
MGNTKVEGKGNNDKSVLACINSLERFRGKCRDATKGKKLGNKPV